MVSRGGSHVVLHARYFDANVSRSDGRRVPDAIAVPSPDADWVLVAARRAGFEAEKEDDKRDPGRPGEKGRVLVARKGSKQAIVTAVAKRLRESADRHQATA